MSIGEFWKNLFNRRERKLFGELADMAASFGLGDTDIKHAREFFYYGEWELALDQLCTQLYEYDIAVDQLFIEKVKEFGKYIKLSDSEHEYLQELVK